MFCLLVEVCIFTIHIGCITGLTSWNMHDTCGTVISKRDMAGELHLDAKQLPMNLPGDSCKVTITPATLDGQNVMVQFYFTSFKLYAYCNDANVTVLDGASNNDRVVKGLPNYLCDVNSTLEGTYQYFTSSGSSIKLIFNVNKIGRNYPGTFTMKFVSYHIGSCSGTDVHECSNGNCVPNTYSCLEDFSACGHPDSNCAAEPAQDKEDAVSSTLTTVLSVIFVSLFVIFTIGGFCMVLGHGRGMGGGFECFCERLSSCCECIGDTCSSCARCTRRNCTSCFDSIQSMKDSCGERCTALCQSCVSSDEQTTQEPPEVSVSQTTQTSTAVTVEMSPGRDAATDTVSTDSSSSESDSELTPSAPPLHLASAEAPPPSYDEAVAPSYKEYIENKDIYDRRHKHKKK